MKPRTLDEQVAIAMKIIDVLEFKPMRREKLLRLVDEYANDIDTYCRKLFKTKLIHKQRTSSTNAFGYYIKAKDKPTKEAVKEEFAYLKSYAHLKLEGINTLVVEMTKRKCRQCGDFLPATRYFKCLTCEPELPSIDDDFIYEQDNWSSEDDELVLPDYPPDHKFNEENEDE
jgi:hypothetical protein